MPWLAKQFAGLFFFQMKSLHLSQSVLILPFFQSCKLLERKKHFLQGLTFSFKHNQLPSERCPYRPKVSLLAREGPHCVLSWGLCGTVWDTGHWTLDTGHCHPSVVEVSLLSLARKTVWDTGHWHPSRVRISHTWKDAKTYQMLNYRSLWGTIFLTDPANS